MAKKGERWPPVYDLDDLVAEIKRLTDHPARRRALRLTFGPRTKNTHAPVKRVALASRRDLARIFP
jgi:hypothetical protein